MDIKNPMNLHTYIIKDKTLELSIGKIKCSKPVEIPII
jgi:hypothetical protein